MILTKYKISYQELMDIIKEQMEKAPLIIKYKDAEYIVKINMMMSVYRIYDVAKNTTKKYSYEEVRTKPVIASYTLPEIIDKDDVDVYINPKIAGKQRPSSITINPHWYSKKDFSVFYSLDETLRKRRISHGSNEINISPMKVYFSLSKLLLYMFILLGGLAILTSFINFNTFSGHILCYVLNVIVFIPVWFLAPMFTKPIEFWVVFVIYSLPIMMWAFVASLAFFDFYLCIGETWLRVLLNFAGMVLGYFSFLLWRTMKSH